MAQAAAWWTAANVQLVNRPKPPVLTVRHEGERLLKETARTGKALRIPKERFTSFQMFYTIARKHKMQMRSEANGKFMYVWWEPRAK